MVFATGISYPIYALLALANLTFVIEGSILNSIAFGFVLGMVAASLYPRSF